MATNFGFMPVLEGKRYFISYKSEDFERVGEITRRLNEMGVPMWYDYGIEKGELWEREINRNIRDSEAVIIFATKALFAANDTWVRIEFDVAQMYGKKRYVVWLDELNPYEHSDDVHDDLKVWYWNVARLQGIRMAGKSVEQIAWSMVTEFHLIKGNQPQPPSPVFQPTAKKPESEPKPQPIRQTQPMQEPKPKPVLQPQPTSASQPKPIVSGKPAAATVFKDSDPKPTNPSAKPATVKRTPLIVTIAVVLVVAMVGGIWAASTLSDSSTSSGNSTSSDSSTSNVKSLSELDSISEGDHFTFGNYPQGQNGEEEPIEWRVLTADSDKALVISEKLLDCVQYNEEYTDVTWETCTLRSWMNNDFLNAAFSSSEQAKIATVTNPNTDNPDWRTKGGNATQDRIFALSIKEANHYFSNDEDRMAATTGYAEKQGARVSDRYLLPSGEKTGWWWLRSPGFDSSSAAGVLGLGLIDQYGGLVNLNYVAVRPAFWLNLS